MLEDKKVVISYDIRFYKEALNDTIGTIEPYWVLSIGCDDSWHWIWSDSTNQT